MRDLIHEYQCDRDALCRLYVIPASAARRDRLTRLATDWLVRIEGEPESPDKLLFQNHLRKQIKGLATEAQFQAKLRSIVPFADQTIALDEARALMQPINAQEAAQTVANLTAEVKRLISKVKDADRALIHGAKELLKSLLEALTRWAETYSGYDPAFTWWVGKPCEGLQAELKAFGEALDAALDPNTIPGLAVGRDALLDDLAFEGIPYTPEELIEIGEKEYEWCQKEMLKASSELGFGEDWKAALEHVKTLHVAPGEQPVLVRQLALEAIEFVESRDLLTVPDLAKETWRMGMMSPEAQKVNPFFLGGEQIIVSYPTHTMTHEEKLMSMRGNNSHFSRATVQHELIPGHHLQMFSMCRNHPYRELFETPFWIEGWALYWEMLLWDLGFPRGPEDRIGMLFWRMHRCVRVSFSLRFHLGQMTTQECVDTLVERVGHERLNAEGEVRRSFNGSYPPLYQAAYLIGGLQMRALRREFVDSGRLSNREFHDAVMRENTMPFAVFREILAQRTPSQMPTWRFMAPA